MQADKAQLKGLELALEIAGLLRDVIEHTNSDSGWRLNLFLRSLERIFTETHRNISIFSPWI
jgi:hypothetical protein